MIRVRLTVDPTVILEIRKQIQRMPKLMQAEFSAVSQEIQTGFLDEIRGLEPGPVKYPIQWTSDKQRRYVMAKLRKAGNIPYRRTGKFMGGWRVRQYTTEAGGFIVLTNEWDRAKYVWGDPLQPDAQQMFHINTGWPTNQQFEQVREFWAIYGEERLIEAWVAMASRRKPRRKRAR